MFQRHFTIMGVWLSARLCFNTYSQFWTNLFLYYEFGWTLCLPLVVGGPTGVNIRVLWPNLGQDQGAEPILFILYLHPGWLLQRLLPPQPHHLWVRIPWKERSERWERGNIHFPELLSLECNSYTLEKLNMYYTAGCSCVALSKGLS